MIRFVAENNWHVRKKKINKYSRFSLLENYREYTPKRFFMPLLHISEREKTELKLLNTKKLITCNFVETQTRADKNFNCIELSNR